MPGGASAMAAMSDSLRADTRLVAAVQYVRLLIILASLACVAPILKAHAYGAAGSGAMIFYGSQFVPWKFGLLLLLAVVGWLAGTRTRIPAGAFLVPTVLYFLLGLRDIHPGGWPWPILATAYAVMGLQIGGRFHPQTIVMIRRVILPVVGTTLLLLVGSVVLAFFVSRLMHLDFISAYLAATPGGLDSVAAVATDLHVDTTIVVSMHLVRSCACCFSGHGWCAFVRAVGYHLKPFGKPSGRSLLNQCRLMTVKLSSHHWTRSEKARPLETQPRVTPTPDLDRGYRRVSLSKETASPTTRRQRQHLKSRMASVSSGAAGNTSCRYFQTLAST